MRKACTLKKPHKNTTYISLENTSLIAFNKMIIVKFATARNKNLAICCLQ